MGYAYGFGYGKDVKRVATPPWLRPLGPAVDIDLANHRYYGASYSDLAEVRNSLAWLDRVDSTVDQFAVNTPPRTDRGLGVFEADEQFIPNPTFAGGTSGVVGSGGLQPTGMGGFGLISLTSPVVTYTANVASKGMNAFRVRNQGTGGGGGGTVAWEFDGGLNSIAVTPGQNVAMSLYAALENAAAFTGMITAMTLSINFVQADGSTSVSVANSSDIISQLTTELKRFKFEAITVPASAAFARPRLRITIAAATNPIDFTMLLAGVNLVKKQYCTPVILTYNVAAGNDRAINQLTWNALLSYFQKSQGTILVEFEKEINPILVHGGGFPRLIEAGSSAATHNRTLMWDLANGRIVFGTAQASAINANMLVGSIVVAGRHKAVGAWEDGANVAVCNDGLAAIQAASANVPVVDAPVTIGNRADGARVQNSYIKRITIWSRRLTNAELQQVTKLEDWLLVNRPDIDHLYTEDKYFAVSKASIVTTRGSSKYVEDANNSLVQFGNNVLPRTSKGLSSHEGSQNRCSNPRANGGTVGTSTLPTNWNPNFGSSGISRTLVEKGTEDGMEYAEIRLWGTPAATYFDFSLGSDIASDGTTAFGPGQTWTLSAFLKRTAGSWSGISNAQLLMYASPNFNDNGGVSLLGITDAALGSQRFEVTRTFSVVGNTAVSPRLTFTVTIGVPIDITLRVAWPQTERYAFATPPMPDGVGVARSSDAIVIPPSGLVNLTEGTLYAEFIVPPKMKASAFPVAVSLNDGSATNRVQIYLGQSDMKPRFLVSSGASLYGPITPAAVAVPGQVMKVAGRYKVNDLHAAFNGVLGSAGVTTAVMPVALTGFQVGYLAGDATGYFNSFIRRIAYYARALTNAELQQLTL